MNKILILIILLAGSFNLVFAQEFVLSDKIRVAREAAKIAANNQEKQKTTNADNEKIISEVLPESKIQDSQDFCKP